MKLIVFALFISILLESTLITLPLTFLIILFASVIIRKNEVFALAFFAGLFLDILTFKNIGGSCLFFITIVFIVFLYQKKFEIRTMHFVGIFSLLGSFGYLFLNGVNYLVLQTLVSALVVSASFSVFNKTNKKNLKYA